MCPDNIPNEFCPFRPEHKARRAALNTPRIKQMAAEGQILSNFYSPRAICTPSRAGIFSGRDPWSFGKVDELFRILLASDVRGGFTPTEKSFGKYLKELGYSTGYSGKWHLGMGDGVDPIRYTPLSHGALTKPFSLSKVPMGRPAKLEHLIRRMIITFITCARLITSKL